MIANLRDRIIVALLSQRCELEEPCEDCTILAAQDADAVIAALPELTQPVSAEAIGDYRYVCHPCGSSFSFYSSSTMQQFALLHSGSHNPKEDDD